MTSLRDRIDLHIAPRRWLNQWAEALHYLHRPVHPRASPFGWAVSFDGERTLPPGIPMGFIIFASVHFTKLKDEFGYPGLPTKWQVLCLSRMWLHDDLPCNSETVVIAKALKLVQRRWLEIHPPRFPNEPYHVRKVISYADVGAGHTGVIYRAANFRCVGRTVSAPRHKNTRGTGGFELICYIYDLPEPHWKWVSPQMTLFESVLSCQE